MSGVLRPSGNGNPEKRKDSQHCGFCVNPHRLPRACRPLLVSQLASEFVKRLLRSRRPEAFGKSKKSKRTKWANPNGSSSIRRLLMSVQNVSILENFGLFGLLKCVVLFSKRRCSPVASRSAKKYPECGLCCPAHYSLTGLNFLPLTHPVSRIDPKWRELK